MSKINIDEVSAEVKALIGTMKLGESEVAQSRALAQPKLKLIWKTLEAGQVVSGCKSKKEWCKFVGITPRYAQYILKDGHRKRTRKDDGETRVRPLDLLKELLDVINCTPDISTIRIKAAMVTDEITYTPKDRAEVDGNPLRASDATRIVPKKEKPAPKKKEEQPERRHVGMMKKELSAYAGITHKIQKLIDQCRAGHAAKDGYLTDQEYRRELHNIHEEAVARPLLRATAKRSNFENWWRDVTGRAEAAIRDRRVYEEREKKLREEREREYDRTHPEEPTQVTLVVKDNCPTESTDFSEAEVAAMFAEGGK